MTHSAYVALSYAAALILVGGLVLSIWLQGRALRREIEALEASGVSRRSGGSSQRKDKK